MKCVEPINLDRKSGMWGTRSFVAEHHVTSINLQSKPTVAPGRIQGRVKGIYVIEQGEILRMVDQEEGRW
jgi:hypothetical protein